LYIALLWRKLAPGKTTNMKYCIMLFGISMLFGCSKSIIKSYYKEGKYDKDHGIVLCSFGVPKTTTAYTEYYLQVQDKATGKKYGFGLRKGTSYPGTRKHDVNDSLKVYYRALVLPLGKYTVCNYAMISTVMGSGWSFRCKEDFSIPFEVQANTVNYIGNYTCIPAKIKALIGKQLWGGTFYASGRLSEDAAFIKENYADFDYDSIVDQTPGKDDIVVLNSCIVVL
jgi:hypothetical protein